MEITQFIKFLRCFCGPSCEGHPADGTNPCIGGGSSFHCFLCPWFLNIFFFQMLAVIWRGVVIWSTKTHWFSRFPWKGASRWSAQTDDCCISSFVHMLASCHFFLCWVWMWWRTAKANADKISSWTETKTILHFLVDAAWCIYWLNNCGGVLIVLVWAPRWFCQWYKQEIWKINDKQQKHTQQRVPTPNKTSNRKKEQHVSQSQGSVLACKKNNADFWTVKNTTEAVYITMARNSTKHTRFSLILLCANVATDCVSKSSKWRPPPLALIVQ